MDSVEIIKNATVAELRSHNPEGVANLLKSVTVAELQAVNPSIVDEIKNSSVITEMSLNVDGAEKMVKLTEVQGVIDAKDNKITELNNTIATMQIAEFKAKKIAELVPEQYRDKIASRITGTTEDAITECIHNEIAYIREMGGLDNVPNGGRHQHSTSDDIKSQVAKLFGHKE